MKLDLHTHTRYSGDSLASPESALRSALRKGLDGIAITDHNTTRGWDDAREAARRLGAKLILGEEIKAEVDGKMVGEIIGLFLKEGVEPCREPLEIIRDIHKQGGLAIIAHPFEKRRHGFRDPHLVMGSVDGIEVFNSRNLSSSSNEKALELAERHGMPKTGGSDAHSAMEVGNAYTEAKARTLQEFRKALEKGDTTVRGRKSNMLVPVLSTVAKLLPKK
jgi:predicted metal-dependent phosphoesterase TrpH